MKFKKSKLERKNNAAETFNREKQLEDRPSGLNYRSIERERVCVYVREREKE